MPAFRKSSPADTVQDSPAPVSPADPTACASAAALSSMDIFGCHLIDLVVSMLGKPDRVIPYQRQTHPDERVYDNGLAVLEYRRTTATIRTASLEVEVTHWPMN